MGELKQKAERDGTSLLTAIMRYAKQHADTGDPEGGAAEQDVMVDDLSVAELTDLALAAKGENISHEAAIDQYGWQTRALEVTREIKESYGDQISGTAFADDHSTLQIGFKNAVPDKAVRLARTLPAQVELTGSKGFSQKELSRARDKAYDEVLAKNKGRLGASAAFYDVNTGVITINVEPENVRDFRSLRDRIISPAKPANSKFKIDLNVKPEVDVPEMKVGPANEPPAPKAADSGDYMRGGAFLNLCTTGFTVRMINDHSVRGVSSAGHCPEDQVEEQWQEYQNHSSDGGGKTAVRLMDEQMGKGDSAWYSRGNKIPARTFYYDWHSKRYVRLLASSQPVNSKVCKFGVAWGTGSRCTEIADNDFTFTGSDDQDPPNPVTYREMVLTKPEGPNSGGGDSGGPFYWGRTAFGILSAGRDRQQLAYSPFWHLRDLGVEVWVNYDT